jgi:hypothetical protein
MHIISYYHQAILYSDIKLKRQKNNIWGREDLTPAVNQQSASWVWKATQFGPGTKSEAIL